MSAKKKGGRQTKEGRKGKKREYFDQQQENLGALEMEEHDDEEYNSLLKSSAPHADKRKNAYFFDNDKYRGSKVVQEESEVIQDQLESQPQEVNQIAGAIKVYREQRKKESKLLTEDVLQIDKEDQEYETLRKKHKTSDQTLEEAVGLRNQLNFERMLIDYRYNEQTTLQSLKKFPTSNYPNSEELHNLQKNLEQSVFQNLNKLIEVYGKYAQKVFQTQGLKTCQQEYDNDEDKLNKKLDISTIHKTFMENQEPIARQTQKQLIKWSQKTSLINISSSHYSSLIMQTPIGQAKKIVSNWERVRGKSQHKRGVFKILFREDENVREASDPQIFDDFELFTELEKGFINDVKDEQDFRISDTLKYLKNRENRAEKTKDVDRKASKNRKLRFNVHAKLLNFIPSHPLNLIGARDEIVDNFFNCKAKQTAPQKRYEDKETYYIDM